MSSLEQRNAWLAADAAGERRVLAEIAAGGLDVDEWSEDQMPMLCWAVVTLRKQTVSALLRANASLAALGPWTSPAELARRMEARRDPWFAEAIEAEARARSAESACVESGSRIS